jgi:hypothetical protein
LLSHGLALELDAIGVVYQPVEDGVGHGTVATAYNLTRAINVIGVRELVQALATSTKIKRGHLRRDDLWFFRGLRRALIHF